MAYEVRTDHQLIAGEHLMKLVDRNTLSPIVTAARDAETGVWTVHADVGSVTDVTAPTVTGSPTPRSEVITAMINQALAALPGSGYSATVPHGVAELP